MEREEFEQWAVESSAAYRDQHGLWFYRNGGDGLYEAWMGGRAAERKRLATKLRVEIDLDGFGCACEPKVQCNTCRARTVLFNVLTPMIKALEPAG